MKPSPSPTPHSPHRSSTPSTATPQAPSTPGTVSTLSGAAADLNTAYGSSGISNLGDEAVTLTDTSLAASVLNTLDGNTSGTVNANTVSLSGAAADLSTAYASSGISNLGNEAVNVNSGTATAEANSLAAATTGVVTATISEGDLATLSGLNETDNAYTITVTDTSVDASAFNTLDATTSVSQRFQHHISHRSCGGSQHRLRLLGISNLGDEDITLTDASLAADVLNTLDSNTTGTVNANTVNTLSGAAADLNTAYDSDGISNLGDEEITLTDTSLAASVLNTLDGNTTGTVNAGTVSTLSGAAADLNTAYDSSGISNLGDEEITLTDASLAASVLNTLDSNTTGTVNADTVNTLSGAAADLNTAYDSSGISNLGDEESPSPMPPSQHQSSTRSTPTPQAPSTQHRLHTLSGAAADLNTAYDSDGISNLGDEDITLSDASLAARSQHPRQQHHRHRQRRHRQHTLWCRSRSQHRLRLLWHQQPR